MEENKDKKQRTPELDEAFTPPIMTKEQLNWKPTTPEKVAEMEALFQRFRKEREEYRRKHGLDSNSEDAETNK